MGVCRFRPGKMTVRESLQKLPLHISPGFCGNLRLANTPKSPRLGRETQRGDRSMEKLKAIVDEAIKELDGTLSADQKDEVAKVINAAVIHGMLEGQHRAVDACHNCTEAEQDTAHKIATAIRKKNDALIVNLSSMR